MIDSEKEIVAAGKITGLVTNIQRYSINDGPGIRTTVFVKGCPLSCFWCHNPECINSFEEVRFIKERCAGCGACVVICPEKIVATPEEVANGKEKIDRRKCTLCLKCIAACRYGGLVKAGELLSVDEVLKEVKSDSMFYSNSGGGMTLSGGEPLIMPEFTMALLKGAKDAMLHVCLDTCGNVPWEVLEEALDYVDLLLYDIKHMDAEKHREATGVTNELILANAEKASKLVDMLIRIPVIPGFNDSTESMEEIAQFAQSLGKRVKRCDLLPFHNWAGAKYESLGMEYSCIAMDSVKEAAVKPLEEIFHSYGLATQIGG